MAEIKVDHSSNSDSVMGRREGESMYEFQVRNAAAMAGKPDKCHCGSDPNNVWCGCCICFPC